MNSGFLDFPFTLGRSSGSFVGVLGSVAVCVEVLDHAVSQYFTVFMNTTVIPRSSEIIQPPVFPEQFGEAASPCQHASAGRASSREDGFSPPLWDMVFFHFLCVLVSDGAVRTSPMAFLWVILAGDAGIKKRFAVSPCPTVVD